MAEDISHLIYRSMPPSGSEPVGPAQPDPAQDISGMTYREPERGFRQPTAQEGAERTLGRFQEFAESGRSIVEELDPAVRSLAQGMSLEWADEFAATMDSIVNDTTYEEEYAKQKAIDESIPATTRIPGTVLGAMATGGPVARGVMAGAKGVGGLAARGGLAGMVEGIVAGAGAGEPGERAEGAAEAGGLGAVLGVGAPVIGHLTRKAIDRITTEGGKRAAREQLRSLMEHQDLSPDDVEAAMRELGPTATMADVSDYFAVKGREALRVPSPSRQGVTEMLDVREAGRPARLGRAAGSARAGDFDDTVDELIAKRQALADPLYKRATEAGNLRLTKELETLLSSPKVKSAIKDARGFNPEWTEEVVADHDMRILDRVYKALEGSRSQAYRAGNKDLARQYRSLKDRLGEQMAGQVEEYGEAVAIHSGYSALKDAADTGRDILKMDPREIREAVGEMDMNQRGFFHMGLVKGLDDMLTSKATATGDIRKLLKSGSTQNRLRAAFESDEEYKRFIDTLSKEFQMVKTERLAQAAPEVDMGGSGVADLVRSGAVDVALGMPGIATARSLRHLATPASRRAEAGELLDALYVFTPTEARSLLSETVPPAGYRTIGAGAGSLGLLEGE